MSLSTLGQHQNIFSGLNNDWIYSIHPTSDGNLIMTGTTQSYGAGNADILTVKTNKDGDTLWTTIYGGSALEYGFNITQMSDGGYTICGESTTWGSGIFDAYLIRTNANGDTFWTKVYGGIDGEAFTSVLQPSSCSGCIIASGYTESFGEGDDDIYVVKTDSAGNILWSKTYGDSLSDVSYAMIETSDGGFLLAGSTTSSGAGMEDAIVMKIDASGNLLWNKTFGGAADYEDGNFITPAPGGAYIISGRTGSFGAGNEDVFLFKVDTAGNLFWTKAIGGVFHDKGYGVATVPFETNFAVCGGTMSFGPGMSLTFNAYFIKVDSSGSGTCHTVAVNPVITNPIAIVGTPSVFTGTGGISQITATQVTSGLNVLDVCGPVGEENITTENNISVYPNPFSTETTLRIRGTLITNEVAEFVFYLYDVLGKEIKSYSIKSFFPNHELTLTIPRGNVKSGIYFYELNSPDRVIGKGKLVITN